MRHLMSVLHRVGNNPPELTAEQMSASVPQAPANRQIWMIRHWDCETADPSGAPRYFEAWPVARLL